MPDSACYLAQRSISHARATARHSSAYRPIEIEAQNDALTMLAQQDVTIESASRRLVLRVEKGMILNVGGSYIEITPDMIENGPSGQILEKCASWDKPGASTTKSKFGTANGASIRPSPNITGACWGRAKK